MVQPGIYNCPAKRLETRHVEGDVVINQKNRLGAVLSCIAYILEHPLERIRVELTTAHRDNRAETAIERTTARGFDNVDLAPEHGITAENARVAVREPYLTALKTADRSIRIVLETVPLSV